jgi:FtsP/CotA-like multicopper oxidase with cupredoxin domain
MTGRARWGPAALALPALAGLAALLALVVIVPRVLAAGEAGGTVREYWIAAVPVRWHVVPNERNAVEHEHFLPSTTSFRTVVYRAFTRDWGRMLPKAAGDRGLQGPLLRARVGDTILVHFRNLDSLNSEPHSMHFHGVRYRFGSDGSYIPGFSGPGGAVRPGQSFTYRLEAVEDSAGVWPYHDHSPSMSHSLEGGLYGALSILGRNEEPPDREFVVFLGSQLGFMTIDGRAFVGNTPTFHARAGELVQWDVLALGDDFHTFHVHGHRWRRPDGTPEDVRTVGPAESFRVRWREQDPGTWLYHCHVEGHMMNGMIGLYRVTR